MTFQKGKATFDHREHKVKGNSFMGSLNHPASPSLTPREGFLLFLVSLFLLLLPFWGGGIHPFGEGLLKILLLFTGIIFFASPEQKPLPKGLYWGFFLLLWASLSLFWTVSIHLSLLFLSHWASGLLFAGILYQIKSAHRVYLVPALGLGLMWLGRMSLLDWVQSTRAGDPTWRVFASFANPNLYAHYLILLIPLFLGLFLKARRLPWVVALGLICAMAILSLVLTGSRGGMFSLGLGFLYCLVGISFLGIRQGLSLEWREICRGGVRLVLLSLLLLPFWSFLSRPIAVRIGERRVQQTASSKFRLYTWRATLKMIRERPITGTGAGSFPVAFPRFAIAGYTRHSHNTYLQVGSELGLPGLISLLGITLWVVVGLAFRLKKGKIGLGLPLLWGLSAGAIHNLVEGAWLFMACQLLWWGLAGYFMEEVENGSAGEGRAFFEGLRSSGGKKPEASGKPFLYRGSKVKLLYLGTFIFVGVGLPAHFAEGYLSQIQASSGAFPSSLLMTALKIEPWNSEAHRKLAEWYSLSGAIPLALREIDLAIRYEPTNGVNYYRKGQIWEMAHQEDLARQAYEQAIYWDPNSTRGWLALANLLEKQGRIFEAEKAYQQILRIQRGPAGQVKALQEMENPDYALAYLRLAEISRRRDNLQRTLEYARAGLERVQSYWRSLKVWKPIYQASGLYRSGEEEQMKGVEGRLKELEKEALKELSLGE